MAGGSVVIYAPAGGIGRGFVGWDEALRVPPASPEDGSGIFASRRWDSQSLVPPYENPTYGFSAMSYFWLPPL